MNNFVTGTVFGLVVVAAFMAVKFSLRDRSGTTTGAVPAQQAVLPDTQSTDVDMTEPYPRAALPAESSPLPVAVAMGAAFDAADIDESYQVELATLHARIDWLEARLIACGESPGTSIGNWCAMLRPEEQPTLREIQLLSEYMADYPVQLLYAEGLWLLHRLRENDWLTWGPSIDEAIILYLGPTRIAREVPPDALAKLQDHWSAEGFFQ